LGSGFRNSTMRGYKVGVGFGYAINQVQAPRSITNIWTGIYIFLTKIFESSFEAPILTNIKMSIHKFFNQCI
jgi:hypothetical protein